jgi:hypothetical protein
MASAQDIAQILPALKHRYTEEQIETLAFDSPAFAELPKDTKKGGDLYIGAIRSAIPSSRSASDAQAFSNGNASQYLQWQCPYFDDYGAANVSGRAIDRANGDENAMVNNVAGELDGMFEAHAQSLGSATWGNGGGSIGQISSGFNTTTITLTNVSQAVNFWIGQQLQAAVDDGSLGASNAGLLSAGAIATVTGVNIGTGVITCAAGWSTAIPALTSAAYLFMAGDYGAKFYGIPAWIPPPNVTVTSTPFCNVNRAQDPVRLSGRQYTGNGAPKSESMTQMSILLRLLRGKPDRFYVNHLDYADILKECGSRVTYDSVEAFKNPQISFPSATVKTETGDIKIVPDPFVPVGFGWMIQLNTWLIASMGKTPKIQDFDGQDWLRQQGADIFQTRSVSRLTSYCMAPFKNGVVQF